MLRSATTQRRLALPMLSATVLFTFSGGALLAQKGIPPATAHATGQAVEVIGRAATVVRTVHYQTEVQLGCSSSACQGNFPEPGSKRRLNITRMTCRLHGTSGSTVFQGFIELFTVNGVHLLYQWLPVDHSASNGTHMLNRAVDLQVRNTQRFRVALQVTGGTADSAVCTATGTRDTLQ